MIIAIMGDTFDKVTEDAEVHGIRQKLALMSDYERNFRQSEDEDLYLFVIVVQEEESDE